MLKMYDDDEMDFAKADAQSPYIAHITKRILIRYRL